MARIALVKVGEKKVTGTKDMMETRLKMWRCVLET